MADEDDDRRGVKWPQKAYKNERFLTSRAARSVRMLAEFEEPRARFEKYDIKDTIVFFGSARILPRDVAVKNLEAARAHGGDVKSAERALGMSRYYEEARLLAGRFTEWSKGLNDPTRRFVVCSGGGPGVMEAANRGASEAKGLNIGLNISLPFEQSENPFITRELAFEFHYFFMRKYWFAYLAKALVVFPGGFGTLDELMEILTLVQTEKLHKKMVIVLYGTTFWKEILNFDALVKYGLISPEDLNLFHFADDVDTALKILTDGLTELYLAPAAAVPDIPHIVD